MSRSVVQIGNASPAFSALLQESLARLDQVYTAYLPLHLSSLGEEQGRSAFDPIAGQRPLQLLSSSPLACHNLFLDIANKIKGPLEVFFILSPLSLRANYPALKPASVNSLLDDLLKVWFFLAKDCLALFEARAAGKLYMVLTEDIAKASPDENDIIGPVLSTAFKSFVDGVLSQSIDKKWQALGFMPTDMHKNEDFAAFCYKIIDEDRLSDSGKWHRLGRPGLFTPRR